MRYKVTVVVPSHKRAGRVDTVKNIERVLLCIPESQKADYLRFHPKSQIVTHPDSVVGMYAKRNWMLNRWRGVPLFLADDDVTGIRRMWTPQRSKKPSKLTPVEARCLIESLYQTARELGAKMWGFANSGSPLHYESRRPYKFGHSLHGTCQGFLPNHSLFLPAERNHVGSDLWVSMLCLHRYRYMLIDTRFFVDTRAPKTNPGGMREFDYASRNEEAMRFMVRCFGPAIRVINIGAGRCQAVCPWKI
jgi:hypothetical protein